MPAHSGVWLKLYPCSGSQMPCSQMMSMNCTPPRPSAMSRLATLPAANARMRNSDSRNSGSGTLVSTQPEGGRGPAAPGVGPPHRGAAVRQQAVGDPDQDRDQAGAEQDVAPPVHPRPAPGALVPQHEIRPHGAERPDGRRDEEDQVPVDRAEHAAEQQPDETTG